MTDTNDFFDIYIKKTYPQLYSRDTTGNIRVWFMEQNNNQYRTHSGVQNGQFTITEWTTAEGKNAGKLNETTDIDQATKEIEAKYRKQRETGYFDDIKDVDKFQYFQPMLAHKWKDYGDEVDWTKGVYISPKLDGTRCIFTKNGCFSRNGKPFVSFPHIGKELKPLFDKDPNLILDGEIYAHKLKNDFEKLMSLARKTKPTPQDIKDAETLQYWIFDCPSIGGTYHERYIYLKKLILENYRDNKWIRLCIHTLIKDSAEIEKALQEWLQYGFEGAMVNLPDGLYENKRSKNLLKRKEFIDEEFIVIGITEGQGNRSKMFGYATLQMPNGKTFDSNARGNEDQYKEILKNKNNYIGKTATVRYQNLTGDGLPRFPVIVDWKREDYE